MQHPLTFVLFGSTGDLAQKKIMPALYKLFLEDKLPQQFTIIAFSRRKWTDEDYRSFIRPWFGKQDSQSSLEAFLLRIRYVEGRFEDVAAYGRLGQEIKTSAFFYLAVQPEFYEHILNGLSDAGLLTDVHSRILVEKPFGRDEVSAKALESEFEKKIKPEQLLRVDHYLAKEGLRELVKNRKENPEYEKIFNNKQTVSIHARILETIGIEGRGEFYERVGALLDVGQNHLMEMLAAVLMDIHNPDENKARAQAIASLKIIGEPVFGQYEGYLQEPEVAQDSKTETYFKLSLESGLEAWQGIPIVLEAGKAMVEKKADIALKLKDGSTALFDIQQSKTGRDAYEILLEHALAGNTEYFASFEEVLASWRVFAPILEKHDKIMLKKYPRGVNGPTT